MKSNKENWENEYQKRIEECHSTQGHKKLWAYFYDVVKTDYVQNKILLLKNNYSIPKNGYKKGETYTTPPEEWSLHNDVYSIKDIIKELGKICEKFHLHHLDWYEVLEHYLFFNEIESMYHINSYNLCLIQDLVEEKREIYLEKQGGTYNYNDSLEKYDDDAFPVVVRISPYASQRDIIDYVKKMYPTIKDYQDKYKNNNIKIGRIKSKNSIIQKRNNLIYNNRNKTLKEIRKLLANKNHFLDDGHISKIISLEKQKRKDL